MDNVVAVEDGQALEPGQEHGDALGDAGADQVTGGGAPAIVEEAGRQTERATRGGTRLYLRLAVDYSARSAILAAAGTLRSDERCDENGFLRRVNHACHSDPETPSVDLVIRTSGEQRLSDFLLFESAYAELIFIETLWPDFDGEDLRRAVEAFRRRERRYGGLVLDAGRGLESRDEGDRDDGADEGEAVGGDRRDHGAQAHVEAQVAEVVGTVPQGERDHAAEEDPADAAGGQSVGAFVAESRLEQTERREQADADQQARQEEGRDEATPTKQHPPQGFELVNEVHPMAPPRTSNTTSHSATKPPIAARPRSGIGMVAGASWMRPIFPPAGILRPIQPNRRAK